MAITLAFDVYGTRSLIRGESNRLSGGTEATVSEFFYGHV